MSLYESWSLEIQISCGERQLISMCQIYLHTYTEVKLMIFKPPFSGVDKVTRPLMMQQVLFGNSQPMSRFLLVLQHTLILLYIHVRKVTNIIYCG